MARVLVVEDDADVSALVVRRLQNAGHRVQAAFDAVEAIALVTTKGAPEVVVLDINMPGADGFELLTLLRERTGQSDLPAVFLSGRRQEDDIAAGRALGAVYLTKPFVGNALLAAIESQLKATAQRDEW